MTDSYIGEKFKNLKVDEFTSPCSGAASPDTPLSEIMGLMDQEGFRHVPILSEGRPVGIISDRDIRLLKGITAAASLKVSDVMVKDPFCVSKDSEIDEVAYEMSSRKIGSALVLDASGEVSGIFTTTDALNALIEIIRGEV